MAGCEQRLQCPARTADAVALGEPLVRLEVMVDRGIEAEAGGRWRLYRAIGHGDGSRHLLQSPGKGRMVSMGMGDEDVGHGLAPHRVEKRCQLRVVVRPWVDHRHVARTDDIAIGALEGIGARVVHQHAADEGGDAVGLAGRHLKVAVELQVRHAISCGAGWPTL